MTMQAACALALLLAVGLDGLRRLLALRGLQPEARPAPWRTLLLLLLSAAAAALLYLVLFPPVRSAPVGRLTVLTAHAGTPVLDAGPTVALPEASAAAGAVRAPDLATALRQHAGTRALHIIGDGLSARDLPAAAGLAIEIRPAPAPGGLVEYWQDTDITPGMPWRLRGRINALPNAEVRLLDPAGRPVAQARIGADGGFTLGDMARGPGLSEYMLQVRDAGGKPVESLTVPIAVESPAPLRILDMSGAPNAELKMLRRWAVDVGADLDSRILLAPGMALRGRDFALTPPRLRETDLLIVDERAWQGLSAADRRNVQAAVRGGLGLLLRVTGPLAAEARADFAGFGFRIREAGTGTAVRLPESGGKPQWPALTRRPVQVDAPTARVLLEDRSGRALAMRRDIGLGRVGVLWLVDSYRLQLAGFGPAHARIWRALVSDLARARQDAGPDLPAELSHPGWRSVFCRVGERAQIDAPDATRTVLLPVTLPGRGSCAGFWPMQSGWHRLHTDSGQRAFYVHPDGQGRNLRRQSVQLATRQLAASSAPAAGQGSVDVPGSPWPWFAGWLMAASLLWWLERSRFGLARNPERGQTA